MSGRRVGFKGKTPPFPPRRFASLKFIPVSDIGEEIRGGNALIQALATDNLSREHQKMRVTYFHVAFTAP